MTRQSARSGGRRPKSAKARSRGKWALASNERYGRLAKFKSLSERFEWHYTPKHGSWLDLAESELGVLSSQCSTAASPTGKLSSRKSPLGSTTAIAATPKPIGTSRQKMPVSNLTISTLHFE